MDLCAAVVCVALDECHDIGECDPSTGVCSDPDVRDACEHAVAVLEARAALPRPADAEPTAGRSETLPRAVGEPGADTSTLPKASDGD